MYYEIHDDGQGNKETVILSSGLGGSHSYWHHQLPQLKSRFRVIVYDHLGTGQSQGDIPQGYSIADMAREVVVLLDQTDSERVHFIGHALGGLVGLQLAAEFPNRVSSLLLINAWDKTDENTKLCFEIRKSLLRNSGVEMFFKAQPLFLYPAEWMKNNAALLKEEADKVLSLPFNQDNLLRRIAAVESFDISENIDSIRCVTGVIASCDDLLVPYSCSETLHKKLSHSSFYLLEKGGHACNVSDPVKFNKKMLDFYNEI
ncbi:pyrimidine utilization protein D [Vibrio diazotrophicus]|uniref:Putative carbamate hydrolase RutD n=1 Tax=Vibrio diazotrophicus TaxID=685 RepID=A0A2J8HQI6_VIBDI|nr:pyrimidine utilization protein D [Vibrio diazotrophicus]PNI00544.1 pyrimidine utilization protein D [Vibrio diazotrophicus]PNI05816.1 pyrimidine utilization protein D [Vibrio diazotrophicus]